MFNTKVFAVSMALTALGTAPAAMADLNGGGATLPETVYQTAGVLTAGFAPYLGVSSGRGKVAFLTNDYSKLRPGITNKNVHWVASDSKLTSGELLDYRNTKQAKWGKLIQVPSFATSVAIPFNKTGTNAVNLTLPQLCGVFSGRLTTWQQISGSGRTGAITVVYQSESSGTTELFTRFLNAKCTTEAKKFAITTTFKDSYGFISGVSAGTLPAGAVPADTSKAAMNALNAREGRITYMSPAYAASTLAGLEDATKVAKIAGVSPSPANISAAIDQIFAPTEIRPNGTFIDATNQDNWVPVFAAVASGPSTFAYPSTGYPILGFTNLIFSQCYADANQTTQVQDFFLRHYDAAINNDTAINDNRFVPLPANWKQAVTDTFATASNAQGIGNTSVCNQIGRPL